MKDLILGEIRFLKEKMVQKACEKGLDHPHVLKISQEIDELHNDLNRILEKEKEQSDLLYKHIIRKQNDIFEDATLYNFNTRNMLFSS